MTDHTAHATLDPAVDGSYQVWGLWDAADLVSLHVTEQGARDAREAHLFQFGGWAAEDQNLSERAIEVLPILVEAP